MRKLMLAVAVSAAALVACSQDVVDEKGAAAAMEAPQKSKHLDMDKLRVEREANQAKWAAEQTKPANISAEADAVLSQVEQALSGVSSIDATLISVKDSDIYGHEKNYEGRLVFEFGGKVGTRGRTWYEAKQTAKGKTKHIRGVRSVDGMKELHLLKERVVAGGANARSGSFVARALSTPYGSAGFMSRTQIGIGGDTMVLEGQKEVAGTLCNIITVTYSTMPDRVIKRFYFGVEDGLLHRDEVEINTEDGKQVSYVEVVSMKVNEPLAADQFEIAVPEHFAVERYVSPSDRKSMTIGVKAPDWTLPGADGKEHSLSDYRGELVLLDFWATWCGPCKAKMPHIQELHEEFKGKGLKVISVLSSDGGHEEEALEYVQDHGYTFDLVYGNEKLSEEYMIRFLPTVLLVDAEGAVIHYRDDPGINDGIDEEVELHEAITDYLTSRK